MEAALASCGSPASQSGQENPLLQELQRLELSSSTNTSLKKHYQFDGQGMNAQEGSMLLLSWAKDVQHPVQMTWTQNFGSQNQGRETVAIVEEEGSEVADQLGKFRQETETERERQLQEERDKVEAANERTEQEKNKHQETKKERDNARTHLGTRTTELGTAKTERNTAQGALTTKKADLAAAKVQNQQLTQQRDNARGNLEPITQERDAATAQNLLLKQNLAAVTAQRDGFQNTLTARTTERDEARQQRDAARLKVTAADNLINVLKARANAFQYIQNRHANINNIITGFHAKGVKGHDMTILVQVRNKLREIKNLEAVN